MAKGEVPPPERDEALRILYRLRAEWSTRRDRPAALAAVESLIKQYEEGGRAADAQE
jgi:hypothetical protein